MSLQPARLKSSNSSPTWRDRIWTVVRKQKKFTIADVVLGSGMARRSIRDYLDGLERAGFISQETTGDHYLLVRDVGPEAPVLNHRGQAPAGFCIRDALWRTMKLLKEFTVIDLAVNASTEQCRVTDRDARTYLRALVAAGYVVALDRDAEGRPPGGRLLRYRFLASRNTGPRPPLLQQVLQVVDLNEGKVVWQAGGEA
jgi:predicted ArsR family transcriptional regulator